MKALVVDDDVYCLSITSEFFRFKGFDVTAKLRPSCSATQQELDICIVEEPFYDVVISDNRMPGMTGLEFFELIDQKGCYVPASRKALLTGDMTQAEYDKALERGYKVFQKPCSLDLLDAWLSEVLG